MLFFAMVEKENVIEPEVLGPESEDSGAHGAGSGGSHKKTHKGKQAITRGQKIFWGAVAFLSGVGFVVDMIIPTFEDFIPVLGWLDEGMLGTVFLISLGRLGVEIPFLSRFVGGKSNKEES